MQLLHTALTTCSIVMIFVGQAHAVNIPATSNPWRTPTTSATSDPFAAVMSEFPAQGALPYEPADRTRRVAKELKTLADQGDLRARLVLGSFSHDYYSREEDVFETFEQIDRSEDPKLLYEIAKIMQLQQSLCMTVTEENGAKHVERRCSESYNSAETERLINERNERYIGYFLKAAKYGYSPAQYELALILLRRPSEIPDNKTGKITSLGEHTATEWLEVAAISSPQAKSLLGNINNEAMQKKQAEDNEKALAVEHAKSKPKCEFVRFTGIASAGGSQLIAQVLASPDIEDTLARNPIQCDRMGCYGVVYLKNHRGRIVNWSKDYLTVASPIDFDIGRRDIFLTIRRGDAACQK